jgi:WD40 repeat protein
MSVWFVSAIDAKTHAQDVNSVRVNPVFPNLLSSASDDGTICLWLVSYKE